MTTRGHILTVLEGKWFKDNNVSVRDVLRPLMEIWTRGERKQGDAAIYYEMFTTEASFKAAIEHAFGHGKPKVIYIAAHGDEKTIHGYHDEALSRAKVKNSIPDDEDDHSTKFGILFGACGFGCRNNAEFLLGSPRVGWVAGYQNAVDWYDASLLEAFFIKNLLFPHLDWRHQKRPETPVEKLKFSTSQIKEMMPGIAKELGFCVVTRRRGGGYIDLMESDGASAEE